MNVDHEKIRREGMRWNILSMLNKARPHTTSEAFILDTMGVIYPGVTAHEIRRELDYLRDRKLIEINKQPSGAWFADLTHYGVDVAEYTVECFPGIARPAKYWA